MTGAQTARILRVFRAATPAQIDAGARWYDVAHAEAESIARDSDLTPVQAAGVIAALSPQVSWGFNLEWARELSQGSIVNRGLTLSHGRALMIARNPDMDPLDILGGNKTRAFFQCIATAGMTDAVCVDRHAYDIATGVRLNSASLTDKRYRATAEAYRAAARHLQAPGETPHILTAPQLQAITWVSWRARYWAAGAFDPRTFDRVTTLEV